MPKVALIMGSQSDLPTLQPAIKRLRSFEVEVEVRIMSAHRTPDLAANFSKSARENGFDLLIAAAGKAAHLPGVLAAFTTLPVIGVPVKSSFLDGMDSLLSIVQMPPGIPVATVGIDAADNAAILAVQMLALKYPELEPKLKAFKAEMEAKVIETDQNLQKGANC